MPSSNGPARLREGLAALQAGKKAAERVDDEQRRTVGTLYKQDSALAARKLGATLVARNIAGPAPDRFKEGWPTPMARLETELPTGSVPSHVRTKISAADAAAFVEGLKKSFYEPRRAAGVIGADVDLDECVFATRPSAGGAILRL